MRLALELAALPPEDLVFDDPALEDPALVDVGPELPVVLEDISAWSATIE